MTDLTALTEITNPSTDDILYVVDAPGSSKNPRKVSILNLIDSRTKTLLNTTIDADGTGNSITNIDNANIKSSAGIDHSKLASLTSGRLLVGNGSNVPTGVDVTGDVTISNAGVTAIGSTKVTNGMLAGSIANTKLATDPLARANHTGTQAHTTISDFDTGVRANRLDQMTAPTGAVALNSQKITGLADGVAATDAATKGQVDVAISSDITLKGAYNANTNSPNLDSSPSSGTIKKGDHYVVSVAGTFYSEALQEGDSLISEVDNPSAIGDWIITNSQIVTPIVTANIADEAVTEGKLYISNAGNNGEFLSKQSGNNGGLTWATVPAGYNAPTIGNTSITSGGTFTDIDLADNTSAPLKFSESSNDYLTFDTTNSSEKVKIQKQLCLYDSKGVVMYDDDNNYYSGFKPHGTTTANYQLILPPATSSTAGQVLKMSSTANTLEWGSAGGADTNVAFTNTTNTAYAGDTNNNYSSVGAGNRDIYIKKVDSNTEGVFAKIWKNGAAVEVQLA